MSSYQWDGPQYRSREESSEHLFPSGFGNEKSPSSRSWQDSELINSAPLPSDSMSSQPECSDGASYTRQATRNGIQAQHGPPNDEADQDSTVGSNLPTIDELEAFGAHFWATPPLAEDQAHLPVEYEAVVQFAGYHDSMGGLTRVTDSSNGDAQWISTVTMMQMSECNIAVPFHQATYANFIAAEQAGILQAKALCGELDYQRGGLSSTSLTSSFPTTAGRQPASHIYDSDFAESTAPTHDSSSAAQQHSPEYLQSSLVTAESPLDKLVDPYTLIPDTEGAVADQVVRPGRYGILGKDQNTADLHEQSANHAANAEYHERTAEATTEVELPATFFDANTQPITTAHDDTSSRATESTYLTEALALAASAVVPLPDNEDFVRATSSSHDSGSAAPLPLPTQCLELAASALPILLPPWMIPAEGMQFTMESAQQAEHRRMPLNIVDDDWQAVDESRVKYVRDLMSAFRQPFQQEAPSKKSKALTDEDKADWLRFQQDHAELVKIIINSDDPILKPELELRCMNFYRVLKETHEKGCVLMRETPNQKLKLSQRIEFSVRLLGHYPVLQLDVLEKKHYFEMAANPDAASKAKLANQWSNWTRAQKKKATDDAAEATRVAASTTRIVAGELQPDESADAEIGSDKVAKGKGGRSRAAKGLAAVERGRYTPSERKARRKAMKIAAAQATQQNDGTMSEANADGDGALLGDGVGTEVENVHQKVGDAASTAVGMESATQMQSVTANKPTPEGAASYGGTTGQQLRVFKRKTHDSEADNVNIESERSGAARKKSKVDRHPQEPAPFY
ncbi:hypothetical protein LTR65_003000 [Meristemomyces frigidus]